MATRKKLLGRDEIKDRVEKAGQDMREKEDILDDDAADIETVRKTLEQLEGGTSEGFEKIEGAIEDAENVTTEAFEKEDTELEQIQNESQEFGNEVNESKETSESDLSKISDASAEFKTNNPDKEFLRAKEEAIRDIDLLKEQEERERHAREDSDTIQEQLRSRVHKNTGG
ncbi:MAG: hypothetical protein HF978_06375 [Desulfobacteraceae bacterium]|nr:hypothetical protein [Desulfobacteraceae bacterium]MBC2755156.1 hypothetical protein [Desulfobacteraceae bacterium]